MHVTRLVACWCCGRCVNVILGVVHALMILVELGDAEHQGRVRVEAGEFVHMLRGRINVQMSKLATKRHSEEKAHQCGGELCLLSTMT